MPVATTDVRDGGGTATAVLDQPPADLAPAPTAPAPVAPSRKSGGTSALAAVNLLSPWVLEELAVRRLRMRFLAAGIALVVLVAGAYGVLWMHLDNTREELRGDDAVAAGLNKQIKDMNDVQTYVGDVTVRGKAVATAMGGEVAFSGVFVELRQAMPGGADLTGLTVTLPAEPLTTDESRRARTATPRPSCARARTRSAPGSWSPASSSPAPHRTASR